MDDGPVTYKLENNVAVIQLDDGKANAVGYAMINGLTAALDQSEKDNAGAVLLIGRPGKFSAGFDLNEMAKGKSNAQALCAAGAKMTTRLYLHPRPVVMACTGHALAAGGVFLLAGDYRIGITGKFKLGFNEIAIGLPAPFFLTALMEQRMASHYFTRSALLSEIFTPEVAVEAGLIDEVVEPEKIIEAATAKAEQLCQLPSPVFGDAKKKKRSAIVKEILDTLEADLADFELPTPD